MMILVQFSNTFLLFFVMLSTTLSAQIKVHPNAHAHNDYKHTQPLTDALSKGFASIEADVFLIKDQLIVSHTYPLVKRNKNFEELYLKPLLDSCQKNKGSVYPKDTNSIILLVDIKSDAANTYERLKIVLEKYSFMLSSYKNGVYTKGAVTIILSGNKPYENLMADNSRYMFIDENLFSCNKALTVCPLASTKYSNLLSWTGKGELKASEKENLIQYVKAAHAQGKKVRLWASPENKNVWELLLACGVDLINTDKPEMLDLFLKEKGL
ncbi:MAG: phosphatidylinositol-specific phospholipase C/glycerophosphodiester phosphodiesterase family protein [Bacteroidia bacterium]|nr:phosphatidylinositol-specific phospholipase C/glycerophosphodiester phosphodiesterase family protein [Bacteroidia bacterium]